ncbi:hypothetical protein PoB_006544700 [Plakobranchus ocellatus]|uniref:Uncharacterized protein n=1 Tax=Plakobranchus ocellatus TaxID=259542 RepID=A0AAV4D424_9GAST|nr:hypothetical protein PoB_006544700 [Plakobranchus ocellatus]
MTSPHRHNHPSSSRDTALTEGPVVVLKFSCPLQGDLRLSGPPPGQGAGGGARTWNEKREITNIVNKGRWPKEKEKSERTGSQANPTTNMRVSGYPTAYAEKYPSTCTILEAEKLYVPNMINTPLILRFITPGTPHNTAMDIHSLIVSSSAFTLFLPSKPTQTDEKNRNPIIKPALHQPPLHVRLEASNSTNKCQPEMDGTRRLFVIDEL